METLSQLQDSEDLKFYVQTCLSIEQAPRYYYWFRFKRQFFESLEIPSKL